MDTELRLNMSVEEFRAFLKVYFPEVSKACEFIVDKMTNDFYYDEKEVASYLVKQILPLINDKMDEIREARLKKEVESKS